MTEERWSAARLAAMRREYVSAGLDETQLADSWLDQLHAWLGEAERAGMREPNAMVLATADRDGTLSARTVLLKGLDERGLVFHTSYASRKARQLAANPRAALLFPWADLGRQVHVEGRVEPVAADESDRYWATRPRGAQLGAAASPQSAVIASRSELDDAVRALAARHPEPQPVPRPERWGGLRVVPERVEFWQGRPDRLHDRLRYRRADGGWTVERLAP